MEDIDRLIQLRHSDSQQAASLSAHIKSMGVRCHETMLRLEKQRAKMDRQHKNLERQAISLGKYARKRLQRQNSGS